MNEPDSLDLLLQKWRPQPSVQPDFEQQVQARLAGESSRRTSRWLRFPAALPLAASLAIAAGTIAGTLLRPQPDEQNMADAYARSIDPVSMAGHHSP